MSENKTEEELAEDADLAGHEAFIGFCDICGSEAVTDCDDCGRLLCANHAFLHDGIQCRYCIDDYYNEETGDYDGYGYDSTPLTDKKIERFSWFRKIKRRIS